MTSRLRWRIRMRTDGAHSRSDGTAPYRRIGWTVVRVLATTTILVIAYYLLPLDRAANWGAVTILVIGLLALIVLMDFQALLILGVGIKIILGAASRGQQRRRQERQDAGAQSG